MDSDKNIFKILIATDNHLGFAEKDNERGDDSFNTFKEIMEMGEENSVDFILLGGDLFHDNKPSRQCLVKCMELLKTHTFGNKSVEFEFVSDPAENFPHLKNPVVNFHDPNLNVAIPVFSIHGNHDDPAGQGQLCALDMLAASGLINYFGRTDSLKEINMSPLLLVKGTAKLAIYGLSAIKDERLFRLFKEDKVRMLRPKQCSEEWFNMLVLHQNHTERPPTNYVPEEFLDDFLDLVIWGHEHECKVEPHRNKQSFFVMQPGSSVATSLCEGEAVAKHVAILQVNAQREIRCSKMPLRTVRPFVFQTIVMGEQLPADGAVITDRETRVEQIIEETIEKMITLSKEQLTGHPRQPSKPLLRLRVEYSDERDMFNVVRFGHRFDDRVANTDDMILFRKFRKIGKKDDDDIDRDAMDAVFNEDVTDTRVEDLVQQYFLEVGEGNAQQLQVMTERGLANAVTRFVDKDDREAIADIFQYQVERTVGYLSKIEDITEDNVDFHVNQFREARAARQDHLKQDQDEANAALDAPTRASRHRADSSADVSDGSSDDSSGAVPPAARGRGRGRGSRGPRGGRAARGARGKGAAAALDFVSNSASTRNGSPMASAKVPAMFSQQSSRSYGKKGAVFDSDSD